MYQSNNIHNNTRALDNEATAHKPLRTGFDQPDVIKSFHFSDMLTYFCPELPLQTANLPKIDYGLEILSKHFWNWYDRKMTDNNKKTKSGVLQLKAGCVMRKVLL